MPISPKKLPSHSQFIRVFYIGEPRLTSVESGSRVWMHFLVVYKELLDRKSRRQLHQGRGKMVPEPTLYVCRTYGANLKKLSRGVWHLLKSIRVEHPVDDEGMIVLKMETALETGQST